MLAVYFCTIFLLVTIQAKTLVIRDSEEVSTEDRAAHLRKIAAKLRAYITKVKGSSWVCVGIGLVQSFCVDFREHQCTGRRSTDAAQRHNCRLGAETCSGRGRH